MVLAAKNLAFSYPFKPIFKGLSFSLPPSSLLQLEGPNGAGKTTLVKIIAGLLAPQQGQITYHGSKDFRQYLEYLPSEGNGHFGDLDALSNLRFWLKLRGREASDEALLGELEKWGLAHRAASEGFLVGRFSTGMKRRLALSRVVLSGTRIWLLDEPLYGLDEESVKVFKEALRVHLTGGGSVIMVSHDKAAFEGFEVTKVFVSKSSS